MTRKDQAVIECHFRFKCPRVWSNLAPTSVENVRHCGECDREVYLVLTDAQLKAHAAVGHCVAVPVAQPASTGIDQYTVDCVVGEPAPP